MPASSEQALTAAKTDAHVVELKESGLSFTQIGDQLGVTKQVVHRRFQRAIVAARQERTRVADSYIDAQLARVAWERELLTDIANTDHPVVSNGKVFDDLIDDAPVMAAVDRLIKLDAQEADLLGLKAPAKSEVDVTSKVELVGVDLDKL